MSDSNAASYDQVRDRLDEIVEAVNAPGISLDEALALYEEAVKLGLSACDLSEEPHNRTGKPGQPDRGVRQSKLARRGRGGRCTPRRGDAGFAIAPLLRRRREGERGVLASWRISAYLTWSIHLPT